MLYSLLRPIVFRLDPETAHDLVFFGLDQAASLGLARCLANQGPARPVSAMGIDFPNGVGLAAGLDKNAAHLDGLASLGFGFIEVGTVTPRPQPGNPRPRLFRLPEAQALINRMGFNNLGVDKLIENVASSKYRGVLGINIGKNFDTPIEKASDDYLYCLDKVYARASYVTVNISSPNTKNLRDLQSATLLDQLLGQLKLRQAMLAEQHRQYVPLLVKIAPDLDQAELRSVAAQLVRHKFDGVIATNTTTSRQGVEGLPNSQETGGLSGKPLRAPSTSAIRVLADALEGRLPIIGVGGILSGSDAADKIAAGASLVQLYTGLIYRGPELVHECVRGLANAEHPQERRRPT